MSPMNNFASYRPLIKQPFGAFVPCYGNLMLSFSSLRLLKDSSSFIVEVHLKDLLYLSEANDDWIDEKKHILNLDKMQQMGNIISHFRLASLMSSFPFSRCSRVSI